MKVTLVSICETDAAKEAGKIALTPELLAATGARYSRNNEGLEAIVSKIDPNRRDASVDSIFRMIDYGHQSIADMVPVAIFMDEVSIYLAYLLWSFSPQAGGQESSTRYIKLSPSALLEDEYLEGIALVDWHNDMEEAFRKYEALSEAWQRVLDKKPELLKIPSHLLNDASEKARKQVARMKRNFAFDRARYLLPAAAKTNVFLVMSARAWAGLCRILASERLPEAQRLAALLTAELGLSAPHLMRHAGASPEFVGGIDDAFLESVECAKRVPFKADSVALCDAHLEVFAPDGIGDAEVVRGLRFHTNRYAWQGSALSRTGVRFSWDAVTLAEIRDLNRHRTGSKFSSLVPRGFYCAEEEVPSGADELALVVRDAAQFGRKMSEKAYSLLLEGNRLYFYYVLLGTQFDFEHITTADKFIYEAELRTGVGAHYRYAKHLRDALNLWYKHFPSTRGVVLEGSAEPE